MTCITLEPRLEYSSLSKRHCSQACALIPKCNTPNLIDYFKPIFFFPTTAETFHYMYINIRNKSTLSWLHIYKRFIKGLQTYMVLLNKFGLDSSEFTKTTIHVVMRNLPKSQQGNNLHKRFNRGD
jgi:hypothetical protein